VGLRGSWRKKGRLLLRYSTRGVGTVHKMAARVWGSPGSLREAERYDCSCLIRLIHLLFLYREVYLTPKQAAN